MRVGLVVVKAMVGVVVGSGGWLEAHGLRPAGLRTSIGKARVKPRDSRWLLSWFPPRVLTAVVAGSASICFETCWYGLEIGTGLDHIYSRGSREGPSDVSSCGPSLLRRFSPLRFNWSCIDRASVPKRPGYKTASDISDVKQSTPVSAYRIQPSSRRWRKSLRRGATSYRERSRTSKDS